MQASPTETVIDVAPDGRVLSATGPDFGAAPHGRTAATLLAKPWLVLAGAATLGVAMLALLAWITVTLLPVVALVALGLIIARRITRPRRSRPFAVWAMRH